MASLIAMAGCATSGPVHDDPRSYLERAQTQSSDGFTVTAAALSIEESVSALGAPLNNVGIQPVWLKIANFSSTQQWLFPIAIDENYFPTYEVARRMAKFSDIPEDEIYQKVNNQKIQHFIPAGAVVSGFVYTHSDEGMKAITVELHGKNRVRNFHFVLPVPGLPAVYFDLGSDALYGNKETVDLDFDALRSWLETMPCCAVDEEGKDGDSLNVGFVGSLDQVRGALISNGWDVTAPITQGSLWRMMTAFAFGSRYRYAPISALYVFGREQDLAFQKARDIIDERNHMRLWLAPVTVDGTNVWIGQVSRDVGVKLSGRFWPPTTHVVDPDMDDARFYVVQELIDSGLVRRLGYVKGHQPTNTATPHYNAEQDPYFTDGLRAIFFVTEHPIPPSQLRLMDWHLPPGMTVYRDRLFPPFER